jgi:tetratricopeptide (TPR) repeat protein
MSPRAAQVEAAVRLHDRAVALTGQGRLGEARELAQRSLRGLESVLGPRHPDVANVLDTLATIEEERGDPAAAERFLRRAAAALRRCPLGGDAGRIRSQVLRHLGNVHRAAGRYRRAGPLLRRALAAAERAPGPGRCEVSSCLNDLGVLC